MWLLNQESSHLTIGMQMNFLMSQKKYLKNQNLWHWILVPRLTLLFKKLNHLSISSKLKWTKKL